MPLSSLHIITFKPLFWSTSVILNPYSPHQWLCKGDCSKKTGSTKLWNGKHSQKINETIPFTICNLRTRYMDNFCLDIWTTFAYPPAYLLTYEPTYLQKPTSMPTHYLLCTSLPVLHTARCHDVCGRVSGPPRCVRPCQLSPARGTCLPAKTSWQLTWRTSSKTTRYAHPVTWLPVYLPSVVL